MIELIISKLFEKRKIEGSKKRITVVSERNRNIVTNPIKDKKTALWVYFASMDGLNVKERGYAVNGLRTYKEYPQSLDFCR